MAAIYVRINIDVEVCNFFNFNAKGSEKVINFFSDVYAFFYTLFSQIIAAFSNFRFIADSLDIIIMTFVVYKAVELFRDTRAKQLFKGIFVLALIYLISVWFNLVSLKWLMIKVVDYGIIALAVVFQPELRRMLEKVGRSRFGMFKFSGNNVNQDSLKCIDAVCRAAVKMQEQKCGALMVIERTTVLGEIAGTGVTLDAEISSDLICNVFYPKSPLHDGGMIIRDGRVHAAGCILPLAQNNNLIAKELGTRHRAAIGMSENSDAVVVVVSEETGTISVAINGSIKRDFTSIPLREELINQIISTQETESKGFREAIKDIVTNKLKFGRTSQNEGNKNDEQEQQKNQ